MNQKVQGGWIYYDPVIYTKVTHQKQIEEGYCILGLLVLVVFTSLNSVCGMENERSDKVMYNDTMTLCRLAH